MSRCLWIPIPNARAGESHRHTHTHREEGRIGAGNAVGFFFKFIFLLLSLSLFQSLLQKKSFLGLGVPGINRGGGGTRYHSAPAAAAALLPVSASSRYIGIYSIPICAKPWKLYNVDLFFGTKLDIYKSGVPSFHFFPNCLFFAFCSSVLSFDLWILYDFISLVIIPRFHLIFFFFTLLHVLEAQKWDASQRTFVGRRFRAAARVNE